MRDRVKSNSALVEFEAELRNIFVDVEKTIINVCDKLLKLI